MKKLLIVLVVLVVVYAIYYFVAGGRSDQDLSNIANNGGTESLGVFGGIGSVLDNPVAKMPSTNPFAAETNPYKAAYQNPFSR